MSGIILYLIFASAISHQQPSKMSTITEDPAKKDLIEKIRRGDQGSFEEFFFSHHKSVFNFLYRFTFDYDTASDLTQETFIKFWQNRENLDANKYPVAYLFKIAKNAALNSLRSPVCVVSIDEQENILAGLYDNPENEYDNRFLLNDFQKALTLLPERCRAIFILSRYHDMPYEEIAQVMEISIQTVKNQMNKSLGILRSALSKYLE